MWTCEAGDGNRPLCLVMCLHVSVPSLFSVTNSVCLSWCDKDTHWVEARSCSCPSHNVLTQHPLMSDPDNVHSTICIWDLEWERALEPMRTYSLLLPSSWLVSSVSSRKMNLPWARSPSVSPVSAGRTPLVQSHPQHEPSNLHPSLISLPLECPFLALCQANSHWS